MRGSLPDEPPQPLCHFDVDVDGLDLGVAFWSAALDAKEEPLAETSRSVYRRLKLPDPDIRILLQQTGDAKTHKDRMHFDAKPTTSTPKCVG